MLGAAPLPPPRIVIVEDDTSLRSALCFSLEADGFQVEAHGSAQPVLDRHLDLDCMIVDLKLPDIDGLTLIALLRDRGVTSPAILITTHPDQRCRERARALGAEVVEKPLMNGELRGRIDALIN